MSSFVENCIRGNALLEEIDEVVEEWHESDSDRELHQFLGMTESEYALWVVDPDVLPFIVSAHRDGRDVAELIEEIDALPLAARAESPEKARDLMRWLKNEGLWRNK